MKKKNALLLLLIPILICVPVWVWLSTIFNPFTLIFFAIGLFLLYFYVGNKVLLWKGRNNKIVNGTCINSEFQRILNKNGVIEAEYHNNKFEYDDGYEKKECVIKCEYAIPVNTVKKLNIGKDNIELQSTINDCKSEENNKSFLSWILGCFGLAVISEVIGRFLPKIMPENFDWLSIFMLVIGVVFSLVGFFVMKNNIKNLKKIKEAKPIMANVVGYVEHSSTDSDGDTFYSYAPKYEYEHRGKIHTYTSSVASGRAYNIGDKVTLYMSDGEILEERGIKKSVMLGIPFFIIGIFLMVYFFMFI